MAGMTSDDCNELQVIQNFLNRLLSRARRDTPSTELLEITGMMSIIQMVFYYTLSMVHKVVKSGKPEYVAKKLKIEEGTEME